MILLQAHLLWVAERTEHAWFKGCIGSKATVFFTIKPHKLSILWLFWHPSSLKFIIGRFPYICTTTCSSPIRKCKFSMIISVLFFLLARVYIVLFLSLNLLKWCLLSSPCFVFNHTYLFLLKALELFQVYQ